MLAAEKYRAPTAAIQPLTAAFMQPDGVHFISTEEIFGTKESLQISG